MKFCQFRPFSKCNLFTWRLNFYKKFQKGYFYKIKKVIKIDDIDVNEILVSKKESYDNKSSFKYFFGYSDDIIRLLCIKLPQLIGYVSQGYLKKTIKQVH